MSTDRISVVHIVPSLHPRNGGPSRTVVQLADALARHDLEVQVFSQGATGEPSVESRDPAVRRCIAESDSWLALNLGFPLRQRLLPNLAQCPKMVLHGHGLWHPANHWTARHARDLGIPLMIHPRGMLEPWAIDQKAWKKRFAMTLFQRRDLESARLLVATSAAEFESIRRLGFRNAIAIIPNGVELVVPAADTGNRWRRLKSERRVLFLSRVHWQKGLLNLVRAWSELKPAGWRLCFAGPDEDGHVAEVMKLTRELGVAHSVRYLGEVDGVEKSHQYNQADLFVLPTFSENFGVVVAEALAHGLPVITTRGAPWSDLETYGCGWWVDIGVDPLVNALRGAMALSDAERGEMGQRGRAYVQRYDWNDIAKQMVEAYRWVVGVGPKPACVQTD